MKYLLFACAALWLFCQCGDPAATTEAAEISATETPAVGEMQDFNEFYQRFHQDSLFQMAHIQWPLEGIPSNADSLTLTNNDFRFLPENWRMHRSVDYETSGFRREFFPVSDSFIIEKVTHRQSPLGMMRRWLKSDGEWRLIYYAGMNNLSVTG